MIKTSQKSGKIRIPNGKKVAVALCIEFGGQTVYTSTTGSILPCLASFGELEATKLLPRVLEVLKQHNIHATFFIPGHCLKTYPDECLMIKNAGHEIACQGYTSKDLLSFQDINEEEQALCSALDAFHALGITPVGFRSPSSTISENTFTLLEKYNFLYDNSLMGNDLNPYYPRPIHMTDDGPYIFGDPSKVLELPTSLHMDDFPFYNTIGTDLMLPHFDVKPPEELRDRVLDTFEYANRFDGSMMAITIHPQTSGQRSQIIAFDQLISQLEEKGAWFATCQELANSAVFL